MDNDPNDKPFEMKSQQPTDIGDNTPIVIDSAEATPTIEQPATGPKSDRTLWLTIGGIAVSACCVVFILAFQFMRNDPFANLFDGYTYETPVPVPTFGPQSLTATQRAWVRPSGQPSFGSAQEAKQAAEEETLPHVEAFAGQYPYQPDINQPNDVYIYDVSLGATQTVIWDYGWCTTTQEILEQNFAQMKVEFVVNGTALDNDLLATTETQREDGGHCRTFTALITDWPSGQHQLEVRVTFLQPTDDGWNLYPAGTHTFKYFVNVP